MGGIFCEGVNLEFVETAESACFENLLFCTVWNPSSATGGTDFPTELAFLKLVQIGAFPDMLKVCCCISYS